MRRNRKRELKEQKINVILLCVALVLMAINILILIKYIPSKNNKEVNNTTTQTATVNSNTENLTEEEKGRSLSEKERMQQYTIEFIKNIDNEEFEKAYKVLNEEFKSKYFPTLEAFEACVRERIGTGELTINFTNFERLGNEKTGNIYVLWADVYDVLGITYESKDENSYMNFVVLERDYNDYELSFSIK